MSANVGLIIGNNVVVPPTAEAITSINRHNVEYTSSDEGNVFIGEDCVIDENGSISAPIQPPYITRTANFDTDSRQFVYIIDATAGNITVTLLLKGHHIFVRKDASPNTVTLTPSTGLINGAASANLNTQYLKYYCVCDGTDFYI